MARLTSLTEAQRARLPEIREEWLKIGLCCDTIDRKKAEESAVQAYELAGLTPPTKFIHVASPYQGTLVIAMLNVLNDPGLEEGLVTAIKSIPELDASTNMDDKTSQSVRSDVTGGANGYEIDDIKHAVLVSVFKKIRGGGKDDTQNMDWGTYVRVALGTGGQELRDIQEAIREAINKALDSSPLGERMTVDVSYDPEHKASSEIRDKIPQSDIQAVEDVVRAGAGGIPKGIQDAMDESVKDSLDQVINEVANACLGLSHYYSYMCNDAVDVIAQAVDGAIDHSVKYGVNQVINEAVAALADFSGYYDQMYIEAGDSIGEAVDGALDDSVRGDLRSISEIYDAAKKGADGHVYSEVHGDTHSGTPNALGNAISQALNGIAEQLTESVIDKIKENDGSGGRVLNAVGGNAIDEVSGAVETDTAYGAGSGIEEALTETLKEDLMEKVDEPLAEGVHGDVFDQLHMKTHDDIVHDVGNSIEGGITAKAGESVTDEVVEDRLHEAWKDTHTEFADGFRITIKVRVARAMNFLNTQLAAPIDEAIDEAVDLSTAVEHDAWMAIADKTSEMVGTLISQRVYSTLLTGLTLPIDEAIGEAVEEQIKKMDSEAWTDVDGQTGSDLTVDVVSEVSPDIAREIRVAINDAVSDHIKNVDKEAWFNNLNHTGPSAEADVRKAAASFKDLQTAITDAVASSVKGGENTAWWITTRQAAMSVSDEGRRAFVSFKGLQTAIADAVAANVAEARNKARNAIVDQTSLNAWNDMHNATPIEIDGLAVAIRDVLNETLIQKIRSDIANTVSRNHQHQNPGNGYQEAMDDVIPSEASNTLEKIQDEVDEQITKSVAEKFSVREAHRLANRIFGEEALAVAHESVLPKVMDFTASVVGRVIDRSIKERLTEDLTESINQTYTDADKVISKATANALKAFVFRDMVNIRIGTALHLKIENILDENLAKKFQKEFGKAGSAVQGGAGGLVRFAVSGVMVGEINHIASVVEDHLNQKLKEQLENKVDWCWGSHDSYWMAFYSAMEEFGVEGLEKMHGLFNMARHSGWWAPYRDVCVISDRPERINMDEDDQLHCEDGPTVRYRDSFATYHIQGHAVPGWAIEEPEKITLDDIRKEENAETKRIMRERYGDGRYLTDIGATVVDYDTTGDEDNTILRALMQDDEGRRFLVGTDGSTQRVYTMEVPPEMQNCSAAHSFLCGFDEGSIISQS